MNGISDPILLFGMPRSGTTWLGKIFDSHPDTLYRHEPDSYVRLSKMPLFPDLSQSREYADYLSEFVNRIPSIKALKVSGKLPLFPKNYLTDFDFLSQHASVWLAKAAGRITGEFPVIFNPTAHNATKGRLIWKSIESVGRLGVILSLLPNAKAIFIIRHPCGQIASVLNGEAQNQFTAKSPSSEDYEYLSYLLSTKYAQQYTLSMKALRNAEPIERLAWRWLLTNGKAINDVKSLESCMVISYEKLCKQPLETTRKMFAYTDLQMSKQTKKFIDASVSSQQSGYYSVFKNPMNSAVKWMNILSDNEAYKVMSVVQHSSLHKYFEE